MGYVFEPRGAGGYSQQTRPVFSSHFRVRKVWAPPVFLTVFTWGSGFIVIRTRLTHSPPTGAIDRPKLVLPFVRFSSGGSADTPLNVIFPDCITVDRSLLLRTDDLLLLSAQIPTTPVNCPLFPPRPSETRNLLSTRKSPIAAACFTTKFFVSISDVLISPPSITVWPLRRALSRLNVSFLPCFWLICDCWLLRVVSVLDTLRLTAASF